MVALLKKFGDDLRQLYRSKAMSSQVGSSGGYLIAPELKAVIDRDLMEKSIFAALAQSIPMASPICSIPTFDMSEAHAAGTTPLLGGMSMAWAIENRDLTEVSPTFGQGVLRAKELESIVTVSNQLVDDGGETLGEYLRFAISEAIAFTVDYACFQGDGIGKPMGLLYADATNLVSRAIPGSVQQSDLANMVAGLIPGCFRRAVWACNPTVMADICDFSTYMVNRNSDTSLGGALCGTLFGRPLYVTEKLPVKGQSGDVMLFDPKLYALGTRELSIELSPHARFLTNQTVFRAEWRGDGIPLARGTATLADGSTTAGAFVALN
jgi:HK97 family phage major capsid protein